MRFDIHIRMVYGRCGSAQISSFAATRDIQSSSTMADIAQLQAILNETLSPDSARRKKGDV